MHIGKTIIYNIMCRVEIAKEAQVLLPIIVYEK